jgi:hypothetical protein
VPGSCFFGSSAVIGGGFFNRSQALTEPPWHAVNIASCVNIRSDAGSVAHLRHHTKAGLNGPIQKQLQTDVVCTKQSSATLAQRPTCQTLQGSSPDGCKCRDEVHVLAQRGGHDLRGQAAAGAAVAAVVCARGGVPVQAAAQLGQELWGAVPHRAAVPAAPRRLLPRRRPQRLRIQVRSGTARHAQSNHQFSSKVRLAPQFLALKASVLNVQWAGCRSSRQGAHTLILPCGALTQLRRSCLAHQAGNSW